MQMQSFEGESEVIGIVAVLSEFCRVATSVVCIPTLSGSKFFFGKQHSSKSTKNSRPATLMKTIKNTSKVLCFFKNVLGKFKQ